MKNYDLENLLIESICRHQILGNGVSIAAVAKKLPTMSFYGSVGFACENSFAICKSALQSYGTIVDSDISNQILVGIVGSGIANMNPSVIVIKCEDGIIHIAGAAKEGLIKQRTAEKAVKHFIEILQQINPESTNCYIK